MKRKDGPLKKMVSVKLEPAMIDEMKQYIKVLGLNMTSLIERSVQEYMQNHAIPEDLQDEIEAAEEAQRNVRQKIQDIIA